MKSINIKVAVEKLSQHPYHQSIYKTSTVSSLKKSFERFGGKPLYDIIVVPNQEVIGNYWVVSGMNRFDTLLESGCNEIDVQVLYIEDDLSIKRLIVDLNKQRVKDGEELLNEFIHYREFCKKQKGNGSYYNKIGKELGWTFDKVKTYVMLLDFFKGDGEIVLQKLFDKEISVNQVKQLKKVVNKFPDKFNSEISYDRITNKYFDYKKLEYAVEFLSIDNQSEFEIIKSYLTNQIDLIKLNSLLNALGKLKLKIKNHDVSKTFVPVLTPDFKTDNTYIVKGDNQNIELNNPFHKKIKCIITSPYYGNKRTYGDGLNPEKGHNMDGLECAIDIANSLCRYKEYMEIDGSIYVIIDDFKLPNGEYSCSIEYFVIEMRKRGYYLVGRYPWIKNNPIPNSHNGKEMVKSNEWVFRFVIDPANYYTNSNMYEEISLKGDKEFILNQGCTNHSNDGTTTRGGLYIQGHLKGIRNILEEQNCMNAIRGNVANPEDFFRQADEKKHNATAPIYLTSTLILEGTKEGDLIMDCYNGVGNTMTSALLLNRQYIGIELEENYYQQTCRRSEMTEKMVQDFYSLFGNLIAA